MSDESGSLSFEPVVACSPPEFPALDSVVQELKARRLRNGLSQPQAAEALRGFFFNVTFGALRHWEAGSRWPSATTADVLSRLLKTHPTVVRPAPERRSQPGRSTLPPCRQRSSAWSNFAVGSP